MKKYIIKNCPAFVLMRTGTNTTYFDMCGNAKGRIACKDCTDCLLKQIVEKCKKSRYKVLYSKYQREDIETTKIKKTAQEILNLLEIEEVEG